MNPRGALIGTWLLWVLGPATFGVSFVLCSIWPDICCDPPNLLLAVLLIATHAPALVASLVLLVKPAYRRLPEFWLLIGNWICLAGWLVPGLAAAQEADWAWGREAAFWSARCAAVMVASLPVAGCIRLARARRGAVGA